MKLIRAFGMACAATALAFGLAGCVNGTDYSDLDRPREQSDSLPESIPAYATEELDVESVRKVGSDDGTEFFIARGRAEGVCVLVYSGDDAWFAACGRGSIESSGSGVTVRVVPDGMAELNTDDEWRSISSNVQVLDP